MKQLCYICYWKQPENPNFIYSSHSLILVNCMKEDIKGYIKQMVSSDVQNIDFITEKLKNTN